MPHPIEQTEIAAADLVRLYPPQLTDRNKKLVYKIACPKESAHAGTIRVARYKTRELPLVAEPSGRLRVAFSENIFGYEPSEPGTIDWYVNFADRDLFCAYGGPLFAQDEMQVAEHPALGSLREMLVKTGRVRPVTTELGEPTPVLVMGVERRCMIEIDKNPADGRPHGLYGNQFASASELAIDKATHRIEPPTISNILAMEAPACGYGLYRYDEIEFILAAAYTGFVAAREESARAVGVETLVSVHTGFWGCGAYGGNRVLMAALQLIAADLAGIDRLVFHTVDKVGTDFFATAQVIFENELLPPGRWPRMSDLIATIVSMHFEWGTSDGN